MCFPPRKPNTRIGLMKWSKKTVYTGKNDAGTGRKDYKKIKVCGRSENTNS